MSPAIVGSATLAIELSSTDIVIASMTVSIAHRRWCSGRPSSAGPALPLFSTGFSECDDIERERLIGQESSLCCSKCRAGRAATRCRIGSPLPLKPSNRTGLEAKGIGGLPNVTAQSDGEKIGAARAKPPDRKRDLAVPQN